MYRVGRETVLVYFNALCQHSLAEAVQSRNNFCRNTL